MLTELISVILSHKCLPSAGRPRGFGGGVDASRWKCRRRWRVQDAPFKARPI